MIALVRSETGGFELRYVDVVGGKLNVDKDRHQAVLNNRIDGGRKAGGNGDDFVAGLQSAVAERRRSEARERNQIGRGSGVHQRRAAHAHEGREIAFELGGKPAGGEPEIERGFHQMLQLGSIEDLPDTGTGLSPGMKGCGVKAAS